ncbi:enoyl-CoA hydratase/isomerase family protein [Halalkalibacterium halodurans]|uniref:enoyl-CoA hydratase/isomerase family protein n=1 Tax=Halalkalibacterium halodurans TaxID=86665 RepID=UPI002E24FE64|nr:enoyl-CoA hydratase/isomerase family protein [Halalkalibacterium halodurans]MED4083565.1 enoyl-CoA hydratase/isomerase family protein [Halalkalibacterium halodurans]MED4105878.1 enoyl-CoA hydratase/isomerase family protein [Halalkalibacterium halodurans]MED4109990.1 enoyl-CoA hydratase/isomerase family protein [Halalkalibacterium halodurans]MED4125011.1 enoyl-CoA hydratase/isomerase family protein [Halalkalibacterium halodurans]
MSYVYTEIQNDALYITLDYPEKKNGLDAELGTSLLEAIRAGNNETSIHSIILQSKHRAYFSSGPRLEDLLICASDQSDVRLREVLHVLNHCVLEIFTSPKVTVALINGYAYGGGFNMMLACDRRIALRRAKFLENFHKMGISPDLGASYFLPRIIGYEQTMNLLLEGKLFTSEEALRLGLIQEVCENKQELQERVKNYLKAVSEGYVPAIAATKKLLKGKAAEELKQQLEQETEELVALFKQTEIKKRLEALV